MAVLKKKYKLQLNSIDKIEELLQELYNECDRVINEVQEQMNKLSNSVSLNEEIVDAKAKYAKAMNDFIVSKDKAIGRKLDIAKLMTEIHKYNGNVKAAISNNSMFDMDSLKEQLFSVTDEQQDKKEEYKLNSKNELTNAKY